MDYKKEVLLINRSGTIMSGAVLQNRLILPLLTPEGAYMICSNQMYNIHMAYIRPALACKVVFQARNDRAKNSLSHSSHINLLSLFSF